MLSTGWSLVWCIVLFKEIASLSVFPVVCVERPLAPSVNCERTLCRLQANGDVRTAHCTLHTAHCTLHTSHCTTLHT